MRAPIGAVLVFFAAMTIASAEPRRVLLLHSFGREFSPYHEFVARLRADLVRKSPKPLDIYEASLASARYAEGDREDAFVDYLNALFDGRRLDLIVSIGAPAAAFLQSHRQRTFPSVPAVLAAVEDRRLDKAALTANDTFVAVKIEPKFVIENILTLLPETRRIVVVTGNSPLEKFWIGERRKAFQPFADRIEFTWLNELTLDEMLQRVAVLPADSVIYFGLLSVDAAGIPHEQDRALAAIRAVANAPIFSYVDAHFGRGIVGGPMISLGEASRETVAVALRILGGEPAGNIKTAPIGFATPVFDSRELRRWKISEANLPPGSSVQFDEPTVWQQYGWYVALAVSLIALQTIFILVLLAGRQRLRHAQTERRRAEEAAHDLSRRLIKATEEERSRVARELHDDVTQRLAVLAIDAGREECRSADSAGGAAIRNIREGLVRLSEDVHSLSYRLHPSIVEDLGVGEALKSECERFAKTCPVRLDVADVPEKLPRDVALCLFRVAQEGLHNVARHAEASRTELRLQRVDGGLQLTVRDNGLGFDPARQGGRMSLGHASMRQRVLLVGGRIEIESSPGCGTSIRAWVPVREEYHESPACAAG